MNPVLLALLTTVQARWERLRRDRDAGYSTEAVVVTAALVLAAIAIVAIIIAKVTSAATSIDLGTP